MRSQERYLPFNYFLEPWVDVNTEVCGRDAVDTSIREILGEELHWANWE